jgi:hypothetical protein
MKKLFLLSFTVILSFSLFSLFSQKVSAAIESVDLDVPMFNQHTDLPDDCGGTGYGNYGCTVTAAAMVFNYYGLDIEPEDVVDYNGGCSMAWSTIAGNLPSGSGVSYYNSYGVQGTAHNVTVENTEAGYSYMYGILKDQLSQGYPVILYYHDGFTYTVIHSIVATGYEYNSDTGVTTFFVNDPAGGITNSFTTNDSNTKKRKFHQMFIYHGNTPYTPTPITPPIPFKADDYRVEEITFTPQGTSTPLRFQAARNLTNNIHTRKSTANGEWSIIPGLGWIEYGQANSNITMVVYKNRLIQFVGGNSSAQLYSRSTSDGSNWTEWEQIGGKTYSDITADVYDGKLFITIRGKYGDFYTKYTSSNDPIDSSTIWSEWHKSGQGPGSATSVQYLGRLYQFVRGKYDDVNMRWYTSQNGWSSWEHVATGKTNNDIAAEVYGNSIYLSVKGATSSSIFLTKTETLVGNGMMTFYPWTNQGIISDMEPTLKAHNGKLYLAAKESGSNKVSWKSLANQYGAWSGWTLYGKSSTAIELSSFGTDLHFSLKGTTSNNSVFDMTLTSTGTYNYDAGSPIEETEWVEPD